MTNGSIYKHQVTYFIFISIFILLSSLVLKSIIYTNSPVVSLGFSTSGVVTTVVVPEVVAAAVVSSTDSVLTASVVTTVGVAVVTTVVSTASVVCSVVGPAEIMHVFHASNIQTNLLCNPSLTLLPSKITALNII